MQTDVLKLSLSAFRWIKPPNGAKGSYERIPDGLRVLESPEQHNGEDWLHVSASYPNRLPGFEDMKEVKETFCGKSREAYMVFPPIERYINQHPYVLHLFCMLDGPMLPDFRRKDQVGEWTL